MIPWLATSCLLVSYPDPAERSTDTGRDTVASDESPSPSAETGTASTGPTSQTGATETGLGVQTVTLLTKVGTAQQNVSFVAFQEADGPWTAVTGAGGRYEAAVAPGPFGVVSVCADARGVSVSELRATTQEVVTLQRVCPAAPPEETYEVSGTILGLDPEDDVTVVIGAAVSEVPPGSYSVFALVRSASVPTHLARRDLVEISRNRTVDLDLTSKGTFWSVSEVLPVEATITGERADEIVTVLAQRLLPGDLEVDFSSDATAPNQVHAAPALEGEVNRVIGIGLGTAEGSAQRFVAWHFREALRCPWLRSSPRYRPIPHSPPRPRRTARSCSGRRSPSRVPWSTGTGSRRRIPSGSSDTRRSPGPRPS